GGVDTSIVPAGVYQLTLSGAGETAGMTGDLDITDGVNIVGADPLTTIIEAGTDPLNGIDRVFNINPLLNQAFDTSFSNLTIRYGRNPNSFGADGSGGAITWEANGTGNLTITNCIISDNSTTDGYGGGIAANNTPGGSGTLTVTNSTIQGNAALRVGGSSGVGGGLYVGPHTA